RGAMATVPWPTREIQIRGDRAPMTIRYLQVGLAHDSTFPTDTRSRRPTGSQSQPPAPSSISRSSSSVKRRSSIRFKRCGVNSSSHSHHGGQCLLAPTVHLSLHHRGRDLLPLIGLLLHPSSRPNSLCVSVASLAPPSAPSRAHA